MMRIALLIVFSLLAGFVIGQIRVSIPVKDLGDIFEKSGKVTVTFELTNPYRQDTIFITDIKTSCGCTAVLAADTLILPLTSAQIDVSYDPTGRLGLFVKSIELTTRTGKVEQNKLFLKIAGNVVAENFTVKKKNQELVNYAVAPLYFYPITAYDTSYLDFNYISSFIDDLTYEIDFYQFTTIGLEVELPEYTDLEEMENLLGFVRKKVLREFGIRGFDATSIFFEEPIFKKATDLPHWAGGSIRVYSSNFDSQDEETQVELTTEKGISASKILLDYERFALPEIDEVVNEVNLELIEGKLFLNGELDLNGTILMPWKKSDKVREKTAKKLRKALQKKIDQTTGASKKEVRIRFDSLGVHEADKYRFILWDEQDLEEVEQFKYIEKPDVIVPPLLPTFKGNSGAFHDTTKADFKHFWENCQLNVKAGYDVSFLMVFYRSMDSYRADSERSLAPWTYSVESYFRRLCDSLGGETTPEVSVKYLALSNALDNDKISVIADVTRNSQPEYFTIIPIVHNQSDLKVEPAKPYMVNFDFFFKGIDTGAWGFQRFANYMASMVQQNGFVELRIESSISKIPVEDGVPNLQIAHRRLLESKIRIQEALAKKLIDPNRIIFVDERIVEQGPIYDGTIPILNYRNFHYLRLIPEESLK